MSGILENLCRLVDCNILVTETMHQPSVEYQAETTVTWTKEAEPTMGAVPAMFRAMARKAVENYCLDEGHTVITSSILSAAVKKLLPEEMIERMGIRFESDEEHRLQDGSFQSCDRVNTSEKMVWTDEAVRRLQRVPEGFMRNAAKESVEGYAKENGIRHISLEVAEKGLVAAREQMASAMRAGIGGGQGRADASAS
ncbi:PCP reductase family protein [Acidobacteria bacterium AH-259-D05]|nr:PCP reductase family protein [Acidobacteria bacterium AH-259-D05]